MEQLHGDERKPLKLRCPSCGSECGEFPAPLETVIKCGHCGFAIVWNGNCWDACADKTYRRDFARQWSLWEAGKLGDPKLVYGKDPKRFYRELLEHCNLTEKQLKTMRVLEVGFGHGRLLNQVQQICPQAYGVDLSMPLKSAQLRPGSAIFGNLFNIPFMPHQFDLVICRGVAHVTPDPQKAFACLAEQVAEDGKFYFAGLYEPGRGRLMLRKLFPFVWNYPEPVRLFLSGFCGFFRALLESYRDRKITFRQFKHYYHQYKIDIFDTLAPKWTVTLVADDVIPWYKAKGFAAHKVDYGGYFGEKLDGHAKSNPA